MNSETISCLHRYSNRFQRSTDLVRDIDDPKGLDGYWLTDFCERCLARIVDGFRPDSSHRAWRLTGDFGTGKSSFALLLASVMRDGSRGLPRGLRDKVQASIPEVKRARFVPVLVLGKRESISVTILKAFQKTLGDLYVRGSKSVLEQNIEKALQSGRVPDDLALRLMGEAAAKIVQTGKGDGVLLILDEAGKFLEFAAMDPEREDVYFLQQLSELACRSGRHPLVVVCLFHQGFSAYSESLDQTAQREWDKVGGRYEEIVFHQPLDQVGQLFAAAINADTKRIPNSIQSQVAASMEQAIEMGWFGTSTSRGTLRALPARLFPLDPLVLPVLVRMFQRHGQNERSLFSFLCGHEPFGLKAFSQNPLSESTRLFQLSDLYDYIRINFGSRLGVASYRLHWNVIESTIDAHGNDNLIELRTLKTVGILNLLGAEDLMPTRDAVSWAIGGKSPIERRKVAASLDSLVERRRLHYRGAARGYSLWPYTSVDLDARLEEAKKAIPQVGEIASVIADHLDKRAIVARSHYIKTGNLRYFDVVYCDPKELAVMASGYVSEADGVILVPLCEVESQSKTCKGLAKSLSARDDLIRIIAVPRGLSHLGQAALDALRWQWVKDKTPALNNDPIARDEVDLYRREARNRLQVQVQQAIGLNRITGASSLTWIYSERGGLQTKTFGSGREVLQCLSALCDDVYLDAPKIKNELINRQNPSVAAISARMRLIERMFTDADKVDLGLPPDRKPPEKSMYLSVLSKTGLHRKKGDGWALLTPTPKDDAVANVRPSLSKIRDILKRQPDTRIALTEIMAEMRRPPFGLRNGLFPILLAVIAIQDEQEIAFYEEGTFLRDVGKDAFLRMARAPHKFELQLCKIEGVRSELFQRLVGILEFPLRDGKSIELLDVVRVLCQFVAQLPVYVRNTRRLSNSALAVRNAILNAHEPVHMVFHDLPKACGFPKFELDARISGKDAQEFVGVLRVALDELRGAFFGLQNRMGIRVSQEFGFQNCALGGIRGKIVKRAETLLVGVTESRLKAFAFRLIEGDRTESDWLESLGSLVALNPPTRWTDDDEDAFGRELEALVGRFKRAESAAFGGAKGRGGSEGLRVAVTHADGSERQEVVYFEADEEKTLRGMQEQIDAVIAKNQRLGVAAASRAIWGRLKPAVNEKQ